MTADGIDRVSLAAIAREWGRLGVIGFGGPPAHIHLLRTLCVERRRWLTAQDFEDAIAATNLLPGPASTQLAIFCAWRLRGRVGALVGGVCFIVPGLVMMLALSALFLGARPPQWVLGAAAGAGAAVPAVAVSAAVGLIPASWKRTGSLVAARCRWAVYLVAGGIIAAAAGPYTVVVLALCGAIEVLARSTMRRLSHPVLLMPALLPSGVAVGGLAALIWVALKVGALSYGGGFVIIPLMQHDAVVSYGWMTGAQFLNAVALGQVTPGPVVLTVAAVGYAAGGIAAGVLAAFVAFAPSFLYVTVGANHFDRVRHSPAIQAFLTGAGAASIGAIAGASVPLAHALSYPWQAAVLVGSAGWLIGLRRSVVGALLLASAIGVIVVLAGLPITR